MTPLISSEEAFTQTDSKDFWEQFEKEALFRKDPAKKPDHRRFFVADIETQAIGRGSNSPRDMIIGGYAASNDPNDTIHYFRTPAEWYDCIWAEAQSSGIKTWYVHNGGEFDYIYLLAIIADKIESHELANCTPITQGKDHVIGYRLERKLPIYREKDGMRSMKLEMVTVELRDSYALIPQSLDAISAKLAPGHQKLTGSINWEKDVFNPDNAAHMNYLMEDILGLKYSILSFKDLIFEHYHVWIGYTAGSTAMKAWRATIPEGVVYSRQNARVEAFLRNAYFGGLVFLRDTNPQTYQIHADVNSMYPYVMREFGVPIGRASKTYELHPTLPGFYHVNVEADEDLPFTFIPFRSRSGVLWPTGEFETYLSTPEIETALKHGYQIDVIEGYVFEGIFYIFREFIDICEALRIESQGSGVEFVVKIMQNALYGKFGTNPDGQEMKFAANFPEEEEGETPWTPVLNEQTGMPQDFLYQRKKVIDAGYMQLHWAAWITAQARLTLTDLVQTVGREHVHYGDTDSLVFDASESNKLQSWYDRNPQYGGLKIEHRYTHFQAFAPKCYYGMENITDDATGETTEKLISKAKGVPRRSVLTDHFTQMAEGVIPTVEYASMNSVMSLLKGRKNTLWTKQHRSFSDLANSEGWQKQWDGTVRPIHLDPEADVKQQMQKEWSIQEAAYIKERKTEIRQTILPKGVNDPDYPFMPRGLARKKGRSLDGYAASLGMESADDLYAEIMHLWEQ